MKYYRSMYCHLLLYLSTFSKVALGHSIMVELKQGETAVLLEDGQLTLTKIEDSRCPEDAECFWEGCATANFSYNDKEIETSFTMIFHQGYSTETKIGKYSFWVADVAPYPKINQWPEQSVKLVIEEN